MKKYRNILDTVKDFVPQGAMFLVLLYMLFASSCSNTKYLKDDEKLYTRTWFKWKGEKKHVERMPYKAYDVLSTGYVRTNWNYVTFSRSGLFFYNHLKPSKTWGFRHYMWSVLSKPPVLLSQVRPQNRLLKIQKTLFDQGHFDSQVSLELRYKGKNKKKVQAIYTIDLKPSYHYKSYNYFPQSNLFDSLIINSMANSNIKVGDEYWLLNIKNERQRLSDLLRNEGYFFFKPDFFIMDVDTTVGNKKIDAAIRIKKEIAPYKKEKYTVNALRIFFETPHDSISDVSLQYDSVNKVYFQKQDYYKQKYINRKISILDTSIFKFDNHKNTLAYINGFGIFRQAELIYSIDSTKENSLNANLFLNPIKPVSVNLELNFATKSNDFIGPSAVLSVVHANAFKGAERLSVQLEGGFEWQKAKKRKEYNLGFNSFELGVKTMIEFPRFLLPFKLKKESKKYIPQTYTILGYKMIRRVKYYQMSLLHSNFGYKWKVDNNLIWKLEPLSFSYVTTIGKSQEFEDYLNQYPSVARSFDEQFILGSTYGVTVDRISDSRKFTSFYNNITIDLAGNIANLFTSTKVPGQPDLILGLNYSQFIKVTNDFRYYIYLSPVKQLVSRLLVGVGVPYNKSTVLPFLKQYFAGGSNDLRAFYARTVGPGSYKRDATTNSNIFLDQSGEIKLIGNLEYRFPLTYKLDGAVFLDAGNVWLINEDTSRVGGKFNFNTFYKEIAVGAGFGLRVNLDYVVIRLDASIPLRRPYKDSGKYWTFSSPYLFRDYIFSFAIGYPF